MLNSLDKQEFSESIVGNIVDDKIRKIVAKRLLSIEEDFSDEKYKKAYEYTEQFFELSKNENGYDFSNSNEKLKILEEINLAIYMLGHDDSVLKRLIDCSKEDGKINLDSISKTTQLIKNSPDAQVDIEYTNNLLKKFTKYDVANSEIIFDSMLELSKSYPICKQDGCFENAFEFSFNTRTKEFDLERFAALKEFLKEAGEYFDFDAEDFDKEFTRYNQFEKESLKAYFKEYTNPFTGKITSNRLSPKEFLENITN